MWREPTEGDLCATISQPEIDAYGRSVGDGAVAALLRRTAALFRGAIRTGGRARLSPQPYGLPESVISKAMDYAAFDVLKRQNRAVIEDRRKARDEAEEFLRRLERGEYEPEGWDEPENADAGHSAAQLVGVAPNRVTPEGLMGY